VLASTREASPVRVRAWMAMDPLRWTRLYEVGGTLVHASTPVPGHSALTLRPWRVTLVAVKTAQSIRRHVLGFVIGVIVTMATVVLFAVGALDRLELMMLDFRFRYVGRPRPSEVITHIDINDDALERIHPWPWPRRLHAQLIDTLRELGARAVVMDIVFSEPQPPRVPLPRVESVSELAAQLADFHPTEAILDDEELREAIARAGNVYLSMFFESADPSRRGDSLAAVLREESGKHPDWRISELLNWATGRSTGAGIRNEALEEACLRTLLIQELEKDFDLVSDELARRTGADRSSVERILPGAKEEVARTRVEGALASQPDLDVEGVIERLLPDGPCNPLDVRDIRAAYEREAATRAVLARCATVPIDRQHLYRGAGRITPPLAKLAEAARDDNFVTFEPGSPDGVLREIPLVACHRGRMLRQLAFAVLCDVMDVSADRVELVESGRLILRGARRPGDSTRSDRVVPLDSDGRLLVNWHHRGRGGEDSFRHIAVGRVLEIPLNRAAIRSADLQGRNRLRAARAGAVQFTTRAAAATYEQYLGLVQRRGEIERRMAGLSSDDPVRADLARQLQETEKQISPIEERAIQAIREFHREISTTQPLDDDERREFARIRHLHRELSAAPTTTQANRPELQRRIADRLGELRPLIEGKVCFIGYTATAVADFVTTPVFERCPGVVVHANVFNTLYNAEFIRRAPPWLSLAMIIGCGLTASLITTRRGPIFSLIVVAMGLNVAIVGGGLVLFGWWRISIIIPTVVLAVLGSWALITTYRQLTEGRDKRMAFSRLGQYTSPSLARRIAEEPETLRRVEVREVTCYFSDLKGFTPLSETIGPERTQALLNLYLERMSEVLDRYQAFINKFLGDGVFAFFNPAVNPQPDHARLACEASLDSLAALQELIGEQERAGGDEAFARLRCRIGLATGRAVVGNCGSERKFDYTCIGDTVNLAARLEPANKAFGTQILVAEATRTATKDLYEWRYLGGLRVVGKKQMVPVYELLGRKGNVASDMLEYAGRFEQGVRLYQEQRWVDCITHFARMLARRPDDPGLALYMDRCRQFQRFGPPEDWIGAIELTEK